MSKIVLTEIKKGDALTVDGMNASIVEWNARSNDIDQDNVRQEGVDRRNFAASSVTTEPTTGSVGARGQVNSSTAYAMHSSTPQAVPDSSIGVFAYDPADQVAFKLNLSLEYEAAPLSRSTTPPAGGTSIPSSASLPTYYVAIYYKDDATMASYDQIPGTVRRLAFGVLATTAGNEVVMRGSLGICHNFTTLSTSTSTLNFKVYVWEPSSGSSITWLQVKNLTFYGTRILR